jgi:oligo-1,6-glucosidase
VRADIDDAAGWAGSELVMTNTTAPGPDLTLGPWQVVIYRRQA